MNPQEKKKWEKEWEKKQTIGGGGDERDSGRGAGIKEHEPTKRNKVKQRRKKEGEFVENTLETSYGEAKERRKEGRKHGRKGTSEDFFFSLLLPLTHSPSTSVSSNLRVSHPRGACDQRRRGRLNRCAAFVCVCECVRVWAGPLAVRGGLGFFRRRSLAARPGVPLTTQTTWSGDKKLKKNLQPPSAPRPTTSQFRLTLPCSSHPDGPRSANYPSLTSRHTHQRVASVCVFVCARVCVCV